MTELGDGTLSQHPGLDGWRAAAVDDDLAEDLEHHGRRVNASSSPPAVA